jgi:phage/conjugal plasmid C-4 type zinc finger TraR family protein
MPDFADLGADEEERQRLRALREQSDRAARDHGLNPSGCCKDCGDVINAARLSANPHAMRCLHCQTAVERNRALHK